MNKAELEERLIDFSVQIIELTNDLPLSKVGKHLSGQLIRSATAPALNYGESRSAESLKDFIHKLQIVLKELRESYVCLRIIAKSNLSENEKLTENSINECNELISIFLKKRSNSKLQKKKEMMHDKPMAWIEFLYIDGPERFTMNRWTDVR